MHLSNMVMDVYAMDTAIARLMKHGPMDIHTDVTRTFINDAMSRLEFAGRQVLAAAADGDTLRTQLAALRRLFRWTPLNTVQTRRRIAAFLIDREGRIQWIAVSPNQWEQPRVAEFLSAIEACDKC